MEHKSLPLSNCEIKLDGEERLIVREDDILGIIEK